MNRIGHFVNGIWDRLNSWRLAIAWSYCLLLIYLLICPSPLAPFGDWGVETEAAIDRTLSSYLQHVVAYSGLVIIFTWSYHPQTSRLFALVIGGAIGHALTFEGLQYFVPSRHCDWPDLFCNLIGVALGVGLIQIGSLGKQKVDRSIRSANTSPDQSNSLPFETAE